MQSPPPARKGTAGGERGPLVEAIPRRMRLGYSTEGEVRIAQERIDHLVQALAGRVTPPGYGDPIVMRALTVRLKAQDGGFFIEPLTPETQWVEASPHGVHVEPLTWRWAVTPREAGKGRLVLQVSMRSIDLDGESEEVGPPDRMVEIKVRGTWVKTLLRRALWLVILGVAFAAGKYGTALAPLLWGALRTATGL
jgi:neural Wiskott-Aldrich syndrome protein